MMLRPCKRVNSYYHFVLGFIVPTLLLHAKIDWSLCSRDMPMRTLSIP